MSIETSKLMLLVCGIAILCSCSMTKGREFSERAVAQFHERLNAGNYRDIHRQAHEAFRKTGGEDSFVEYLGAVRRKLGTVKQATQGGWRVNSTPTGTFVMLQYQTEFTARKGGGGFCISGE